MTCFAIGAATWPPVASFPRSPPSSTITPTAMRAVCAGPAGANAVNHAFGGPFVLADVPVLPATTTPGICARRSRCRFDDVHHHRAELGGRGGRERVAVVLRPERRDRLAGGRVADLGDEPRLEHRAAVRDRRGDQPDVQRVQEVVVQPDRGSRERRLVVVEVRRHREAAGLPRQDERDRVVQARRRLPRDRLDLAQAVRLRLRGHLVGRRAPSRSGRTSRCTTR